MFRYSVASGRVVRLLIVLVLGNNGLDRLFRGRIEGVAIRRWWQLRQCVGEMMASVERDLLVAILMCP